VGELEMHGSAVVERHCPLLWPPYVIGGHYIFAL